MPDNQFMHPVIGVGVLVWRGNKILLGKRILRDQLSCWQFPGGHLEQNESVIDCASREVLEETGLKVKAIRHLGFTDQTFIVDKRKYLTLLVSCEYVSGDAQVLEPDKCECWQWFHYKQLPEPLFEPVRLYLAQLSCSGQVDLYALHRASMVLSDTPSDVHK